MAYSFPWRKAITVSLFLHVFLLVAAGYLTSGFTVPVPVNKETVLEMELTDPASANPMLTNSPAQPESSPAVPGAKADSPLPSDTPTTASPMAPSAAAGGISAPTPASAPPASAAASGQSGDNRGSTVGPAAAAPSGGKISGGAARSGGTASPSILRKVDPIYPASARQAGQQGTVLLKIEILTTGRPGSIAIARSSNYPALDEAAVAAARQWQFIPAKDLSSGQAIVCAVTLPVSFHLNH